MQLTSRFDHELFHSSFSHEIVPDDDDDDDPPQVNIANFSPPTASFGLGRGRSSPSQRKAMGRSGPAVVYLCSECGSESVKWMGRCPTCRSWNTLQEHVVQRQDSSMQRGNGGVAFATTTTTTPRPAFQRPQTWLDGVFTTNDQLAEEYYGNRPIRVTDLYENTKEDDSPNNNRQRRRERIWIPLDDELNRVLGGGLMPGSLTLVGGDPGVGKSTLLLQMAASVASMAEPTRGIGMGASNTTATTTTGPVWYVSGEENPEQIASRAERLGISESELMLLSETHVESLCEQVVACFYPPAGVDDSESSHHTRPRPPSLLVVDSIQTMVSDSGGASAAGGVVQVRECVATFLRLAKATGLPIVLVGHVTKSGDVAGPRTVEHMVDCVLYLEGATGNGLSSRTNLRMLRASKNRFGSADEVGIYEMTTGRLAPVSDPSSLFLSHRTATDDSEGSAIAIILEGMRAMAIEIQALIVPADSSYGRKIVEGMAQSRLALIIGVLQKRVGIMVGRQDVYLSIVGRVRLDRCHDGNAGDLAVAVTLVSSLLSIPVRSDTAFVGAIDLSGEIRHPHALDKRLQEARRMGFSRVVTGANQGHGAQKTKGIRDIELIECKTLREAIEAGLVSSLPRRRQRQKAPPTATTPPGNIEDLGLEIRDDSDDTNDFD